MTEKPKVVYFQIRRFQLIFKQVEKIQMNLVLSVSKTLRKTFAIAGLAMTIAIPTVSLAEGGVALEIVAFTLNDINDLEKLRLADQMTADWVATQPGFISRETAAGANGEWIVIVHWATLADAEAAGIAFMQLNQDQSAMSMFDPSTMLFQHYVVE